MTAVKSGEDVSVQITQFFLEDAQFRHNHDPLGPAPNSSDAPGPTPAQIHLEMKEGENSRVVAIKLRVESNAKEAIYHYSVSYTAILTLEFPGKLTDEIRQKILIFGGTATMPFIRETIASLSMKGKFGPTWIAPVNFVEIVLGAGAKLPQ